MNGVLVNGQNYAWGDIEFIIFGVPIIGITEINYSRKRQSPNNYGAGYEPTSYSYKNFEYAADITIYLDELKNIINSPSTPNKDIMTIPPFSIICKYGDAISTPFTTDRLKNVRILEDPFAAKQNDSAILLKIPLAYAGLMR